MFVYALDVGKKPHSNLLSSGGEEKTQRFRPYRDEFIRGT